MSRPLLLRQHLLRQLWAAVCALALVAAALAPAAAAERATLRVTARVVDRCTVEVPSSVPAWLWRHRQHQPWRFVRHSCRDRWPLWIQARKVILERLRDRFEDRLDRFEERLRALLSDHGGRRDAVRHPTRRDVVLITITY